MQNIIDGAIASVSSVLQGKPSQVKLSFACLLAKGHLLVEDLPGMGKTTLATALAKALGLDYSRVQFTSDMLPADILGATVFEKASSSFRFHPGPIFTQLLLADEINRTTPKTQSALLEAMAERQVSIEGETHPLPSPFFVIATQNPSAQFGTFPLPESQLDRFLLRITMGYPHADAERALLKGEAGLSRLHDMQSTLTLEQLQAIQKRVDVVHASDSLLDYIQRLLAYTRNEPRLAYGISPRGGLALLQVAKAWAFLHNRDYVVPEDIQAVLVPVFLHRLELAADSPSDAAAVLDQMIGQVPAN
ncbi:Uncharacterised protein [BD1-7 clade bacterium]|uniref:Uncharacterized protein n=1 Tax=BD1-7 clade bacterium TaxID=2029982 RepID=A0A5S9NT76_9GAMM|nr:Uncharacterised protein [BD1-7 clade bacterium]CAA0093867.1 Uncharacterised protein [BD1-7 clade bacterium]CAA0107415.1 Uncharacterised protein [BD1-7 clade bacterium]